VGCRAGPSTRSPPAAPRFPRRHTVVFCFSLLRCVRGGRDNLRLIGGIYMYTWPNGSCRPGTALALSGTALSVNTKNWYRREADLWTKLGNKFHSAGKDFFRRFGRNACGRQFVSVRQKDCLCWIREIAW
jgi:hypothetical protein